MATWTIANLERNLSDGGVTVAHWRVEEVDGDYSAFLTVRVAYLILLLLTSLHTTT